MLRNSSKMLWAGIMLATMIFNSASISQAAGQTDWQSFVAYNQDRFQLLIPGSALDRHPFDPAIALGPDYELKTYFAQTTIKEEIEESPQPILIVQTPPTLAPVVHLAPSPTPAPIIKPIVSQPTVLDPLFEKYATEYGISSQLLKDIAHCESGARAEATNGSYGGMFQFTAGTWVSNRQAMGLDSDPELRFNGEEAIRTAAFKMSRDGIGAWPACGRKASAQLDI